MKEIFTEIMGENKYVVFEETSCLGGSCYGFRIVSSNGEATVNDVTSLKDVACELAEMLIRNNVSVFHLYDVVEDYICM